MSNLVSKQWKQYYQMPCLPESVERALSLAAHRYYAFLCKEMNVHSAPELHYSNDEIKSGIGVACHKTLSKARRELIEAHLINCRPIPPGVYAHIILNGCGDPIPAPPSRTGVRHYSAIPAGRAPSPSKPCESVRSPTPGVALQSTLVRYCRAHGRDTEHWKQGNGYICQECHQDLSRPPSAHELGFK